MIVTLGALLKTTREYKYFTTTYIHNWPLQTVSQHYGLDSHTIPVLCIDFISEWRDL